MGYKVNFLDNEQVAALDLNSISESLGGGALDFLDDTTYGVTDLNGISKCLIGKGVSHGCALFVNESGVTIGSGTAFMTDGKRVEIDTDGVTLDYQSGVVNYVWLCGDAVTGFVVPRCTTEPPSGDDFVLLGQVSADGNSIGYQDRATMKNSFSGLNKKEVHTVTLSVAKARDVQKQEVLFAEVPLLDVGYRCLVVTGKGPREVYNIVSGTIDFETGETKGLFAHCLGKELLLGRYAYAIISDNQVGKLMVCLSSGSGRNYRTHFRFSMDSDSVLRIYRTTTEAPDSGGLYGDYGVTLTLTLC